MYQLKIDTIIKELDSYEQGCVGNGDLQPCDWITIQEETKQEILDNLKDTYELTDNCILLDSCEEKGRLDFSVMEDAEGCKALECDLTRWRAGEIDLYYVTYIGQLTEVNLVAWKDN